MKINWFPLIRLYILTTIAQILLMQAGYSFLTAVAVTVVINFVYPEEVVTFTTKTPENKDGK